MGNQSQFSLLKSQRFAPLFVTQFLGAFHDNMFKNALVVLMLYGSAAGSHAKILTTLAAGIFIMPFVLFSATGGQLADRMDKSRVIRFIKVAEIGIAVLGTVSLLSGSLVLCFVTLFALGTHSAFFGPSKYSILPQHLRTDELIGGNAVLNTGTFLAILTGTVIGTGLIGLNEGRMIVSGLLFACALAGWFSSRFIPSAPPAYPSLKIDWNPIAETIAVFRYALNRPDGVMRAVFGIGWFYFMGGMFMAQMPNFVHDTLHADQNVLSFLLVIFSIGVAAGGLFNNWLLRGRVDAKYVPLAMLGITLFSFDLCIGADPTASTDAGQTLGVFLHTMASWRSVVDLAMISLCGGLFVVPLDAIIQHRTPESHRARLQAGSAIISSAFVAVASLLSAGLIAHGLTVPHLFALFAGANALAAFYARRLA